MSHSIVSRAREAARSGQEATPSRGRRLLLGGLAAGPLYLVVGLVQAFTRSGFDIRRHDLSLLSNGDLGWIQIGNFLVTGLLVIACAIGLGRTLRVRPGRRWIPLLVGMYGVGLVGAAFFTADPAYGFPPGTPANAHAVSWHGLMHIVSGAVGFLSLIAACFVFARRFFGVGRRGWAIYSILTGVAFLAGFVGIASGSGNRWTILGFWIGLVIAFAWLFAMAWRLIAAASADRTLAKVA